MKWLKRRIKMQKEIQFLNNNLTEIVQAINFYNNEVWFRQFPVPPPLGSAYFSNSKSGFAEKEIKKVKEIVLYINIPFCNNQCDYCGLRGVNKVNKHRSSLYVECLKKEAEFVLKDNSNKIKILAILIGGGTPSLLLPQDLYKLLNFLRQKFEIVKDAQISIEVSPEDVSEKMSQSFAKGGVDRVCIGVQTFNEQKLKQCGRRSQKHQHVYEAVKNLRKTGIDNINLDLIYGLKKNETSKEFLKDNLSHIVKIKPANINFFSLQNHTKYSENIRRFYSKEFEKAKQVIISELSMWSKREKSVYSKYFFLRRCRNVDCVAIGAGGKSEFWTGGKFIERTNTNSRYNPLEYMKDIKKGLFKYDYSMLNKECSVRKFIIHNLNLETGVDKRILNKIFPDYGAIINKIFSKIKDNTTEAKNVIRLKDNFEKSLPFKTKNKDVNYFIFSFCFLYSPQDRSMLIESFKKINKKLKV